MRQCTVGGDDKTKIDTTAMRLPYLQIFTTFESSKRKIISFIYFKNTGLRNLVRKIHLKLSL